MTAPEKLDIRTPDGTAAAWVYRPEGKATAPAVIFFIDAIGVRPGMHQMAERLASLGYFVLLPNLLYRAGDFEPFDPKTVFGDEAERGRLFGIIKSLDLDGAMRDVGAYLDAIASHPGAQKGGVGTVGYCMGGRLAFAAAGHFGERIAAVASFHGGRLVTDEPHSPHLAAAKIKARLYFGVADNDQSCSPDAQAALASALGAAHVAYQIELYPGAMHGFAVPDVPVYDEAASEQHWRRMATLFGETLRPR